jgi:hypothetical protein
LKVTAGAVGATLPLVHVQTAHAAGKLTMGVWDHWVPAANPVLKGLIDEWAAKNKVDVTIDFIASAGNKMILTQAAEARRGAGTTSLPSIVECPPVWRQADTRERRHGCPGHSTGW